MSKSDITYDGKHVFWFGIGNFKNKRFDATSGAKGHQIAAEQDISNKGPIPEGEYSFSLKIAGTAHVVNPDDDNFELDSRQGIESLVDMKDDQGHTYNSSAWGKNRVRLNIIKIFNGDAKHRNGFYLHDSHKGFTHGCIEVDTAFFKRLRIFAEEQAKKSNGKKTMTLLVKYPTLLASTRGATAQ
jgi:hypothetical protein